MTENELTLYQILSIREDATIAEIKKAYRDKVMLFHPDLNKHPYSSKIFISIQKAYEVLSDSGKRKQYDISLEFRRIVKNAQKTHNTTQCSVPQKDNTDTSLPKGVYTIISFLLFFGIIWLIGFVIDSCDDKSNKDRYEASPPATQVEKPKNQNETVADLGGIYIDEKGNYRNIPSDKVDKFLSKYPKARLATNQELSAIERKIADDNERKQRAKPLAVTPRRDIAITRPQTGSSPYNSYYGAGIIDNNSKGSITVVNGTDQDAVAIVYDVSTKKIIRNVYITAGSRYNILNIPEGILRLKSSYGEKWASDLDNGVGKPKGGFTENISFSDMASHEKFEMNWDVHADGINYPIYTITLHKIRDGNLQTKNISKNDFFFKHINHE